MIEIRYLQAESGANKFGTCNCCGKSSGEDPLMISIKFSYYGHGTLICLCDDCKKKLIEVLPPANNSEIPNSSDTISRAKAMDALTDENIINHMDSVHDSELHRCKRAFERILSQLPPAQPEPKREKWIDKGITGDWQYQTDGRGSSWHEWQCDQCKDMVTKRSFYCPNCGADMREVTT